MEALLFTLDGIVFVILVYMGLRDDRAPPGSPLRSLFRMTASGIPNQAGPTVNRPTLRSRESPVRNAQNRSAERPI